MMRARRRLQRLVRKQIFRFVFADTLSKPPADWGPRSTTGEMSILATVVGARAPGLPRDLYSKFVNACGLPTEADAEPQVRRSLHRIFEVKPYLNT